MKPWTRDNTKYWIAQQENRIEDCDYYIEQTMRWLDDRCVHDHDVVIGCLVMTVIWVSHMRNEQITQKEVFEILGINDWDQARDDIYDLGEALQNLDHDELLEKITANFN